MAGAVLIPANIIKGDIEMSEKLMELLKQIEDVELRAKIDDAIEEEIFEAIKDYKGDN